MPLSFIEIKDQAPAFSREWQGERSDHAEARTPWNDFFNVLVISRRRIATFEEPVKNVLPLFENLNSDGGFIDLFWRGGN